MKTLLISIVQIIAASGLLYGYYHLFLRNKKFHQYNRYFLLLATVISICIPFLHIPVYFDAEEMKPGLVQTLTVFSAEGFEENVIAGNSPVQETWFTWKNILSCIYMLIAGFLFVRFIAAIIRIARLVQIYPGEKIDNIHFVTTNEPATPFSFFRWLFWNNKIELNSDNGQQIFRHELFHIRQKHSWDIIFLELIAMIFWINPFFHLIKKEIKAIHEFLADQFAVNENQEWDYAELLLMQVLGSPSTRLTNPFFHNQIKRRIAMLTTSKKPGYQYLRKIMVLPLAAIIVGLFAFTYKNKVNNKAIWSEKPITIVVDAGHGGDDPGVRSPDDRVNEAQLSLEIAKTIQGLAKEYNITVVLTRKNDRYPGGVSDRKEANMKRVTIANELKPDAFISIHINNNPDEKFQSTHSGFEAYISKKRDDKEGRALASVILQNLATLYKTRTDARIRNHTGIYVLDQNNCPAVLLECGFINNAADVAFINDKANQEKIARSILSSIVTFKNSENSLTKNSIIQITDTVKPIMRSSLGFDIKTGTTIIKNPGYNKNNQNIQMDLILFNGKEYTTDAFKKMAKDATVEAKSVVLIPAGDTDAIKKYGPKAKNGVMEFKDAVIVKEVAIQDTRRLNSLTQLSENKSGDIKEVRLEGIEIKEVRLQDIRHSDSKLESIKPNNEVVVVGYATNEPVQKVIFEKAEIEPAFPGGDVAWRKYLERNLNPNIMIENGAPAGIYNVMVLYIVNSDGSISNVKALTNHGYGMETEAMRLIKNSSKWLPAIQNGEKVNAYRKQPVTFQLIDDKKTPPQTNKEVVVVGHPFQKSSNEKIVEGYPSKKTNDEKVVVGYPSKNIITEKVVVGYPSKKTNNEKVVIGYPSKNTITEKVVVGYPIEKKNDTLNFKKLQ